MLGTRDADYDIVVDTPAFDLLLRILERDELAGIQAFITQPTG